uniref:Uncharacterized protein n=1 Tax=Timema cristinae TaxID=61476 RepID=A0A7R9D8H5_TIMCR|nr:unnamed protein product [Timema cristinae]
MVPISNSSLYIHKSLVTDVLTIDTNLAESKTSFVESFTPVTVHKVVMRSVYLERGPGLRPLARRRVSSGRNRTRPSGRCGWFHVPPSMWRLGSAAPTRGSVRTLTSNTEHRKEQSVSKDVPQSWAEESILVFNTDAFSQKGEVDVFPGVSPRTESERTLVRVKRPLGEVSDAQGLIHGGSTVSYYQFWLYVNVLITLVALGTRKAIFSGRVPAFAWGIVEPIMEKATLNRLFKDSNLDRPIICSIVYCERSALTIRPPKRVIKLWALVKTPLCNTHKIQVFEPHEHFHGSSSAGVRDWSHHCVVVTELVILQTNCSRTYGMRDCSSRSKDHQRAQECREYQKDFLEALNKVAL